MDKNRESDRADDTGEPKGRSVTGILAVMGALFVLVVGMQMCQ
jgi:hypothetical protein